MRPHPEGCVTCGDVAVAALVVEVEGTEALVSVGDASERVGIDLILDAKPGDTLLCHAGIALERLEEATA